uniref:F-box domain-containing protein n=1 Tax=Caenorhabditis tropicalis TaxID=1561998 RepID=A0A1I7UST9_9PELO
MAFPLQKLPYLAFEEVLSTMDLRERFLIATSSKKSAILVKKCVFSKKYKLTIIIGKKWDIVLDHPHPSQIKKERYSSEECEKEGIDKTLLETLELIIDVFNKPRIRLLTRDPLETYFTFLPFLEKFEVKVNTLRFDCKEHELQNWLEKCDKIPNIQAIIYPSEVIDFNTEAKYNFEEVCFYFGDDKEWVSHKDLLISLFDCKRVETGCPFLAKKYASQELEEQSHLGLVEILKRWISGSRMEFLDIWKIPIDKLTFSTIFEALGQVVPVKQATYPKRYGGWKTIYFHDNCFMIEQNETGRKAHVFIIHDEKNYYTLLLRMAPENFELA